MHGDLGHDNTWGYNRQVCKRLCGGDTCEGGSHWRLCTRDELCPRAADTRRSAGGKRTPWLWSMLPERQLTGDHWVPIATRVSEPGRRVRDWMEVGDSAGRQCMLHSTMRLPPDWATKTVRLKGHAFCCRGPDSGFGGVPASAIKAAGFQGRVTTGVVRSNGSALSTPRLDDYVDLPWSPIDRYIAWPNVDAVEQSARADAHVRENVDRREAVEYDAPLREARVLNLPSCKRAADGSYDMRYRYLGQMAHALVAPAGDPGGVEARVRQTLRDGVRYADVVWEAASHVVAQMGAFRFSSLHVRRNELQYKNEFTSANQTLSNIEPLLRRGEPLYIATDETRPAFFDCFRATHPRLYRWSDFFDDAGVGHGPLSGLTVPRKLIGCVEQAICAMGRRFFRTGHSTFSGYVSRLRGFVGAPDTNEYPHHKAWSRESATSPQQQPRHTGRMYFIEDPEMWTTTVGPARPKRRRSSDRTGELMAESIDEAGAALHGGATLDSPNHAA